MFVRILFIASFIASISSHHPEPAAYKYSAEANKKQEFSHGNEKLVDPQQALLESTTAVAVISVAPIILLLLIPDLNKHRGLLRILLGFAAGGLLGDAFLHLIPHALHSIDDGHHQHHQHHHEQHSHSHDHDHDDHHHHPHSHDTHSHGHTHDHHQHMIVGLCIVAGVFVFFCIEKFILLLNHGSSSNHSHVHNMNTNVPVENNKDNHNNNKEKNKKSKGDDKKIKKEKPSKPSKSNSDCKSTSGYLNLVADFVHNFTDGLAIGGSFLISRNVGLTTTLTVLLHELPHEIGDYAILIRSGFSSRKAMALQLLTAFGALLGSFVSLGVVGVGPLGHILTNLNMLNLGSGSPNSTQFVTQIILPFTAGGFIYISMTSVLSDLLIPMESNGAKYSTIKSILRTITELCSLVFGVGFMILIDFMEH